MVRQTESRPVIQQTVGGMYSSTPSADSVERALAGDREWEQRYADAGHGEYIQNVDILADYCRRTGSTPEQALRSAIVEQR